MSVRIDPRLPLLGSDRLRSARRDGIPDGRSVILAARLTLSEAVKRDFCNLPAVDPTALVRATAECPAPAFPLGGNIRATKLDQPDTLEIITWNTGEPQDLNKTGNLSHAERQFVEYMKKKRDREQTFFPSIKAIEIDITTSPCTACADALCGLLRDITRTTAPRSAIPSPATIQVIRERSATSGRRILVRPAPGDMSVQLTATLRWMELYTFGPQATNWQSLFDLRKAGWRLEAPGSARPADASVYATMVPIQDL